MWWDAFTIALCFGFLLVSCHGQQDDLLQTLKDLGALLTATESHHAAAKIDHKQMLTHIENLNKNLEKSDQRLEKMQEKSYHRLEKMLDKSDQRLEVMLENTESRLLTKIEAVEKEMRDRSTIVEHILSKVADGQQVVEKNLTEMIQTQMLQMKDELMQRFGEFVDHFGNNQTEATADRLHQEWANFSRNPFSEVPKLHRPTINASKEPFSCNLNMKVQVCHQLLKEGVTRDGIYPIQMEGEKDPFCAYCDMTEDGGGWTVIMRRGDCGKNRTNFYRNWNEYRNGFGNLEREFWLGNEKIHAMTSSGEFQLRITLTAFDGDVLFINYDSFAVESEERDYRLHIGDADQSEEGQSLLKHDGALFSTWDRDNDRLAGNCATIWLAGWWFDGCGKVALTGMYKTNGTDKALISWKTWKNGVVKGAEMKIRPKNFR